MRALIRIAGSDCPKAMHTSSATLAVSSQTTWSFAGDLSAVARNTRIILIRRQVRYVHHPEVFEAELTECG
jgi:hypothetical protein